MTRFPTDPLPQGPSAQVGGGASETQSEGGPPVLTSAEVFEWALAAIGAAHGEPDPDTGLAAARAVLAGLDVAAVRRVAGVLALIAARAGRSDVAEWLERQRLEVAWWTS